MAPATRTNGGSFSDVPPFYEPGAPPPTLPILLAQTELVKNPTSNKLVAQQEIGGTRSGRRSVHFAPYAKPTGSRRAQTNDTRRSRSPPRHDSKYSKPQKRHPISSRRATPSESESSDSESERGPDSDLASDKDDNDKDDNDNDDNGSRSGVIPKPEGEAGRPGRGGYNLEESLEWRSKDYERLKVRTMSSSYTLLIISPGVCEGRNPNPP